MENNNEKLGQEPAFPFEENYEGNYGKCTNNYFGMSKRFYAACAAMQGLLACDKFSVLTAERLLIKKSFELADELLKQENK